MQETHQSGFLLSFLPFCFFTPWEGGCLLCVWRSGFPSNSPKSRALAPPSVDGAQAQVGRIKLNELDLRHLSPVQMRMFTGSTRGNPTTPFSTLLPNCCPCLRREEHKHGSFLLSGTAVLRKGSSQELREKKKVYQEGPARWLSRYRCLLPRLMTWVDPQKPLGRRHNLLLVVAFWLLDTQRSLPTHPTGPHKTKQESNISYSMGKQPGMQTLCSEKSPAFILPCFAVKCRGLRE